MAEFLPSGLSIAVATRDGRLAPNGARAAAAVVGEDRRSMTIFVPSVRAGSILRDLEEAPRIAVLFVRPSDDRACQLKGTFEGSRPARPDERAEVERQFGGYVAELEAIGIARALTAGWTCWPCVAITVRVTDLFHQTPGPGAGAPMR